MLVDMAQYDDAPRHDVEAALGDGVAGLPRLAVEHAIDDLQIVADPVLKFPRQRFLVREAGAERRDPLGGGDGFREHIGEALEEIHVMPVEPPQPGAVHFQHAIGPFARALNNHVHARDDGVIPVDRGQHEIAPLAQIVRDHRFARDEGAAGRRALIDPGDRAAHDIRFPSDAGGDDQIILRGAILQHRTEGNPQPVGAQTRRFREDGFKLGLAKGVAAEFRQGGLLPLQLLQAVVVDRRRALCEHLSSPLWCGEYLAYC